MADMSLSGQRLGEDVSGVVNTGDANEFDETVVETFVNRVGANARVFRAMLYVGGLRGVDCRFVVAMKVDREVERVFDLLGEDLKPLELEACFVCGKIFGVEGRARDGALLARGPANGATAKEVGPSRGG